MKQNKQAAGPLGRLAGYLAVVLCLVANMAQGQQRGWIVDKGNGVVQISYIDTFYFDKGVCQASAKETEGFMARAGVQIVSVDCMADPSLDVAVMHIAAEVDSFVGVRRVELIKMLRSNKGKEIEVTLRGGNDMRGTVGMVGQEYLQLINSKGKTAMVAYEEIGSVVADINISTAFSKPLEQKPIVNLVLSKPLGGNMAVRVHLEMKTSNTIYYKYLIDRDKKPNKLYYKVTWDDGLAGLIPRGKYQWIREIAVSPEGPHWENDQLEDSGASKMTKGDVAMGKKAATQKLALMLGEWEQKGSALQVGTQTLSEIKGDIKENILLSLKPVGLWTQSGLVEASEAVRYWTMQLEGKNDLGPGKCMQVLGDPLAVSSKEIGLELGHTQAGNPIMIPIEVDKGVVGYYSQKAIREIDSAGYLWVTMEVECKVTNYNKASREVLVSQWVNGIPLNTTVNWLSARDEKRGAHVYELSWALKMDAGESRAIRWRYKAPMER